MLVILDSSIEFKHTIVLNLIILKKDNIVCVSFFSQYNYVFEFN